MLECLLTCVYFRSVIGCHRSSSERVPRQVQSDIAMGVVCGMFRFSLVVLTAAKWVVSRTGTKSFTRWSRNVLMSTAGPRPTPRVASCLAYRASHDILETTGLPYMGCWSGAVLAAYLGMSA